MIRIIVTISLLFISTPIIATKSEDFEKLESGKEEAKVLKPQADKIITLGKKDSLQNTKILIY